jgi:elongation factor P hydroxylase
MSITSQSLVQLFNQLFQCSENTVLQGGGVEPIYLPADNNCAIHKVIFTRDYSSSALHEVAHWSLAGLERRQLADYGYWYSPDGRSVEQQRSFEQVEIKPQALEWVLSQAAGLHFRISADNLNAKQGPSDEFKHSVWQQAQSFCVQGMPVQATLFADALAILSNSGNYRDPQRYCRAAI